MLFLKAVGWSLREGLAPYVLLPERPFGGAQDAQDADDLSEVSVYWPELAVWVDPYPD